MLLGERCGTVLEKGLPCAEAAGGETSEKGGTVWTPRPPRTLQKSVGGWVRSLVPPPLFLFRIKRLLLPLADLHLQNGPFPFPRHLHNIPQRRCHSRQNSVLHGDVLRQSGTVALRRVTEVSRVRESSLLVSGGVGDQSGAAQSEESTEEVGTLRLCL